MVEVGKMTSMKEGIKKIEEEIKEIRKGVPLGEKELEIAFVVQTEEPQTLNSRYGDPGVIGTRSAILKKLFPDLSEKEREEFVKYALLRRMLIAIQHFEESRGDVLKYLKISTDWCINECNAIIVLDYREYEDEDSIDFMEVNIDRGGAYVRKKRDFEVENLVEELEIIENQQ